MHSILNTCAHVCSLQTYSINTRDPYFFYYNVQWLPRDISVVRKLPNIKFRQEVRVYHSEYVFKVFHTARKRLCYSLEKKCAYCLDCCLIEIDDSFILILFLICLIRFLISLVTYSSKLNNFIPCGNHSVPITILFSIFECSVLICINLQVFFFSLKTIPKHPAPELRCKIKWLFNVMMQYVHVLNYILFSSWNWCRTY